MASALQMAWQAFQQGERNQAQAIVVEFLRTNPSHSTAWLLLGTILTDPAQRRDCFQRVLALEPTNEHAKAELAALQSPPPVIAPSPPAVAPSPPSPPAVAPSPPHSTPMQNIDASTSMAPQFPPGYLPSPDDLNQLAARGGLHNSVIPQTAPPTLTGVWIAALVFGSMLVLIGCIVLYQAVIR